jgi:hypothetical protein
MFAQRINDSVTETLRDPSKTFVLGMLTVFLVVVGSHFWSEHEKWKMRDLIDFNYRMNALVSAAIDWNVRYKKSYAHVSLDALKSGHSLSQNFLGTPYGGVYAISGVDSGFVISATEVPSKVCESMVRILLNVAAERPTCSNGTLVAIFRPGAE